MQGHLQEMQHSAITEVSFLSIAVNGTSQLLIQG